MMIISNNGRQFDNQSFRDFCLNLGIKNQFSSLRRPRRMDRQRWRIEHCSRSSKPSWTTRRGAWPEELPNILWAYKTTARTLTGETPFRLTYGTEVMISVEVGVTSIRREVFNEESNDDHLRQNLDCLDEVREQASIRMTKYQLKMVEYYNKRVKLRRLDIGDLIQRKVTTRTRDPA